MQTGVIYQYSSGDLKFPDSQRSTFSEVKKYADDNNIPVLFFWGNTGCGQCGTFLKAHVRDTSSVFNTFVKNEGRNFIYYFAYNESSLKSFVRNSIGSFPYIALYYNNGTSTTKKDISRGTSDWAGTNGNKLVQTIQRAFAGYVPKTSCTVTYQANGGTGTVPTAQTGNVGQTIVLSSARLARTGYTHSGWSIDGVSYQFGQQYTLTGSVTALAVWTQVQSTPPNQTPQKPKEYIIPEFQPSQERIPDSLGTMPVRQFDFPAWHKYASVGKKYIRMSNNVNSLCIKGQYDNLVTSQAKAAYINENITDIAPSCFAGCSQLTAVTAGGNIEYVGDYGFYGCTSLKGVGFLAPNGNRSLKRIGDYAFAKSGLEHVKIDLIGSVSDTALHSYCFASCYNLEKVEFVNSTYLGDHMFDGCTSLKTVKMNDYHSYVGEYSFANCKSLTEIELPPKTYMIAPHMFDGCTNLINVKFGNNAEVKQLGDCAFANCSKLTCITLPESVDKLEYFDPCFLSGSSINRVICKGIPDDVFAEEYEESINHTYKTNYWYTNPSDMKKVLEEADRIHIPVIVGSGLPFCGNCKNVYDYRTYEENGETKIDASSIDFTGSGSFNCKEIGDYLKPKNCFWLFGVQYGKRTKNGWTGTYTESLIKMLDMFNTRWGAPTTIIHWNKSNGNVINEVYFGGSTKKAWKSRLESLIGSYSGGVTEKRITIKKQINTFGCGEGQSVTFVSSTGKEYVCTNNEITYQPETKVDRVTTSDFKYGIWYYNARQLCMFADQNNLPVLFEYSSTACDPCRDFRKNTFDNQEFQTEIRKRPCLLSRVELGPGEYFDHPAGTQAYYVSHILNTENTYLPALIYHWKKPDGTVYQVAWNYNYRSEPANANYQSVLQKLDAMLGTYTGSAQYWPPTIYQSSGSNKFNYYRNQQSDTDGRYYICDRKTSVNSYTGNITIDIMKIDGEHYYDEQSSERSMTFGTAASGTSQTFSNIQVGQVVDIGAFTYQYFTTTQADSQYNSRGVIFKVSGDSTTLQHKIEYIYTFENDNAAIPDSDGNLEYETGRIYEVDNEQGFNEILEQCQFNSTMLIIYEDNVSNTAFYTNVIQSAGFRSWLKQSSYIVMQVRTNSFESGVGAAVRRFEAETQFVGDAGSDTVPRLLVYHGCSTCNANGQLEVYCKQRLAGSGTRDWRYYADLIDMYDQMI